MACVLGIRRVGANLVFAQSVESMWAQIINIMLGIWLMISPAVLGYTGSACTNDYVAGPLAIGSAIVATWEVTRPVRWVNLVLGMWLLIAPWALKYEFIGILNSIIVGLLLIVFSTIHGRTKQRFGGGWLSLLKNNSDDAI